MHDFDPISAGWLKRDAATFALSPETPITPDLAPPIPPDDDEPAPIGFGEPPATLSRLDPDVPEEVVDRRPGWNAMGLVILSDGKPWALPLVDGPMLDRNPSLAAMLRRWAAVRENSDRLLFRRAAVPACSPEAFQDLVDRLVAFDVQARDVGLALLVRNYDLAAEEYIRLLPAFETPEFAIFRDAVMRCCALALPHPADLTESEIEAAIPPSGQPN